MAQGPDLQKGIACAWGVKTGNITSGAGVLRFNSQSLNIDGETIKHKDAATGNVIGRTHWDKTFTLECVLYPSAATRDHAKAALVGIPQKGATVTLVDAYNTLIAGAWDVMAASMNGSVDEPQWTVNLTLEKSVDGMPSDGNYTVITP